ncbi:A21 Protein [Salmon gill poxvirus]|uniref:A21 Protein n=1 Tax=Salmon gill poxvirus TaxID=1680908 RepID=A0A0H4XWP3_9POXV|nr:A21 Protein [Salmon gill poxvirus]AKR04246.1 A21 Protein [Salmon gill poxvirus]
MILFALILFFHIFLYNFVIPGVMLKKKRNNRIFNDLSTKLPSNYICINNKWATVTFDSLDIDVLFIKTTNGANVNCDADPSNKNFTMTSCLSTDGFALPNGECGKALKHILVSYL